MKKILVVEDAQALRRDIVEMLGYEGFEVEGAENGLVGVERARQYQPDLIICDIMMPVMDGYGVLEALRRDPSTSTIPFIFLTARTERLDMRQGMELGADDYLTKPFTAQELIRTVQTRLKKRRILDQRVEERLTALRGNIVLALPHELRTPLNVILGFSDLLLYDAETIEPPRIVDMAGYINSAAMRLYRLIENYLIYAQVEVTATNPDQMKLLHDGVTLNASSVIREQAHHWAGKPHPPTEARSQDIRIELEPCETLAIADEYLKKIVEELVDNACKFSQPGTQILVDGSSKGDRYALTVSDLGVGMSQEQIDSIGAYMQFDRRIREQQGAGLGLIVSKRLVELHNGTFTVKSELQKGTQIVVTLPIKRE
jgi:two-component system, sensor histidine kinase and response regulator